MNTCIIQKVVSIMDRMSIFSIFIVSFPEELLIGLIGILAIGKFNFFKSTSNIIRLFIFAIVAAISSYFLRRSLTADSTEVLLLTILIFSLLFIFIMQFKFYESIIAVLFAYILFIIIEAVCYLSISSIIPITAKEIYSSDFKRFLITLPERVIQIMLVILSFRYKLKIIDLENVNIKKKGYYIQVFVYMFSISTFVFLAILMTKTLFFDHGNLANATNTLLLRFNIYLTLFVIVILTLAIRNTHEFYKNKNILSNTEFLQNLDYISHLIEEKNYIEAKESIDNLKTHINKQ